MNEEDFFQAYDAIARAAGMKDKQDKTSEEWAKIAEKALNQIGIEENIL